MIKLSIVKASAVVILLFSLSHGADSHHAHWGYTGNEGPKMWGDLDPSYAACKTEKFQSPINIIESETKKTSPNFVLNKIYANHSRDIINNGHTLQVGFESGNSVALNGKNYELVQLHFHTPSENQINSQSFPAEVHLVHKDSEGNLLVIGVFIQEGHANRALQSILKAAPSKVNISKPLKNLELSKLFPTKIAYYEFQGSLTTPPCSGNVTWVVMQEAIQASKLQLQSLHKILQDNARDTQPINGRTIKLTH